MVLQKISPERSTATRKRKATPAEQAYVWLWIVNFYQEYEIERVAVCNRAGGNLTLWLKDSVEFRSYRPQPFNHKVKLPAGSALASERCRIGSPKGPLCTRPQTHQRMIMDTLQNGKNESNLRTLRTWREREG